MKTKDFNFTLPEELIAQYPLPQRRDSRLLVYDVAKKALMHQTFSDIVMHLEPDDLLVMNDSQVIPARFFGQKRSGGKVEFLIERILTDHTFLAHIKASKSPKPGSMIDLSLGFMVEILEKQEDLYHCLLNEDVLEMLSQIGHIPLPPYIKRSDETLDFSRYQTIYAKHQGSVAAPTAGLHFDELVMDALKSRGVNIGYVTLHVGTGTFRPVRTEDIVSHQMHFERYHIGEELCSLVLQTRAKGKRVVAVGTTALRSLESAMSEGELNPGQGETNIFIYPGYDFKICDGLVTNFHLPESTLLMLVSAFIGHQEAMSLYELAIKARYRFFSYGDACLFLR